VGRKRLLDDGETLTVGASDTESIGDELNAIFRGENGSMADKAAARVAIKFDDTPPTTDDFSVRVVDTVGGADLAVAIPDDAATRPGTANAVPAGVWRVSGPLPSKVWLRFVNDDSTAHTLSECVVYYQDV